MKKFSLISISLLCLSISLFSQTIIWKEDFESYANGVQNAPNNKWTTDYQDCDDGGTMNINSSSGNTSYYWGVNNGEFAVFDIEGRGCICGNGSDNKNFWESETIDVSAYSNFTISMQGRATGDMEAGGGCNSADMLEGCYQINDGAWIPFFSMAGANNNDTESGCIQINSATTLKIRVQAGTQANDEKYFFDNIIVSTTPEITGSANIENGTSQTLSISTTGGTWSSSNTAVATVNASGVVTTHSIGTAIIYYKLTSGCDVSKTITVTAPCVHPTINPTTSNSRCGDGSVVLSASSSTGTIYWYSSATSTTALASGNTFATPSLSGTTTYYVEADNSGCLSSSRSTVTATINPLPVITTTTPVFCSQNESVTLTASSGTSTLNWYNSATSSSIIGTGTNYTTASITNTTSFFVEANNGTCTSTRKEIIVSINSLVTDAGSLPTITCKCNSDSITTQLNANIPVTGNTGTWSVSSMPTGIKVPKFVNTNDAHTNITVYAPGVYVLKWTVTDGTLTVSDEVTLAIEADTIPPTINLSSNLVNANYASNCISLVPDLTDVIKNASSDNCSSKNQLIIEQNPSAGTQIYLDKDVLITITDICGNTTDTTIWVIPRVPIEVELLSDKESILPTGGEIKLNIHRLSEATDEQYTYKWTPDVSNTDSYTTYLKKQTTYKVTVTTLDSLCTTESNELTIICPTVLLQTILIPNSHDPINNEFGEVDTQGVDLDEYFPFGYKINLFNRYGQKLISFNNQAWDGQVDNHLADAGVYFYTLDYINEFGEQKNFCKSSIELIRK